MKVLTSVPPDAVPLQADTFRQTVDGVRLVASRCPACSGVFFPKRRYCGRCGSSPLQDALLGAHGTVRAFTAIDKKGARSKIDPPYVQACIAMPEGLNVYTVVAGANAAELHIGDRMRVGLAEIERNGDGHPVVAYVFLPAGAEDRT